MRNNSQLMTPDQVVARHIFDWQQAGGPKMGAFAAGVREHYEARYPEHARTIEWSQQDDPVRRMLRDQEKLARYLDPSHPTRLPVELYDSVVEQFTGERRFALEQDLSSARGGMFLPLAAEDGASPDAVTFGEMSKEAGDAIAAVGELLGDGVIDSNDADKAPDALRELAQARAKITQMMRLIEERALDSGAPTAKETPALQAVGGSKDG